MAALDFGIRIFDINGFWYAGVDQNRVFDAQIFHRYQFHFLLTVSFFVLLNVGTNMILLYAYLIIYGMIGLGFCAALHPLIPARYFGRKAYGTIEGTKIFIAQIAGIISPVYAGWIFDISGSYTFVFTLLFALSLVAIVIMFFAKPPKLTRPSDT